MFQLLCVFACMVSFACVCVCVCVCERERERECVCVFAYVFIANRRLHYLSHMRINFVCACLLQQNFELLMTFYTPDVYEGPRDPGSYHQIAVVSGDDSSSKRVCYS